ncbi:hypothetical protein ACJZ2D_007513 [Fusarium nematophilum]
MAVTLAHSSLGATLRGVHRDDNVWQFRGISYATIRRSLRVCGRPDKTGNSYTEIVMSPRCPQNHVDFRHMLRIPEQESIPSRDEDEFACLNLDVTIPEPAAASSSDSPLPVVVWIHGMEFKIQIRPWLIQMAVVGGSLAVTFGCSASRLCDPTGLVARSVSLSKPIIFVNVNYRLNMFAFGDGISHRNLGLKDQRSAIEYIRSHIAGFGGDPENITIAGESAGAIYSHAQVVTGAPVRQCILQSGSLYLSSPQPRAVAEALIQNVSQAVSELGDWALQTAPASKLLEAQANLGLGAFFLQMEEQFEGWEETVGHVERVLVGDTEYESVLWRNGIETLSPDAIAGAFDLVGEKSQSLKELYGIVLDRPVSCKLGALDILNDAKFSWATDIITEQYRRANRSSFRFLIDQPNPWQTSSRTHHGIDLVYLFGGFDLSFDEAARRVSSEMQQKWIEFVYGENPWKPEEPFAFGPLGECRAVDDHGLRARRRCRHVDALKDVGLEKVNAVVRALANGRGSLLN